MSEEQQAWATVQNGLESIAREFLKREYDIDLKVPVKINSRLKITYGLFRHKVNKKESISIEIGKNYILNQEWELVKSTLIHECIHYALYELDLPYRDGEEYFENELKKHGSHSTGTIEYKGKVEVYACSECGIEFEKRKRYPNNGKGYTTRCCNSEIKYIGQRMA